MSYILFVYCTVKKKKNPTFLYKFHETNSYILSWQIDENFVSHIDKWKYYLNSNAKGMVFIIARFIANNHAFKQRSHISKSKANTLRAFMDIQCSSYTVPSP